MREAENIVYEAIGGFGAYAHRPTMSELIEASGLSTETVAAALHRLVEEFAFVSGDETTGYRLAGRENGPFSAA